MEKIPLVVTGALTIVALAASSNVLKCAELADSETIQAQIGTFATYGALVSAAFVVYGYLQTNSAFVESQRPQLYIRVESLRVQDDAIFTQTDAAILMSYKNITANQFSDLTLAIRVDSAGPNIRSRRSISSEHDHDWV